MSPPRRWPNAKSGPHTRWRAPRPWCSTSATNASAGIRLNSWLNGSSYSRPTPSAASASARSGRQGQAERRIVGTEHLARVRLEGQHRRAARPAGRRARRGAAARGPDARRRNCPARRWRRARRRAGPPVVEDAHGPPAFRPGRRAADRAIRITVDGLGQRSRCSSWPMGPGPENVSRATGPGRRPRPRSPPRRRRCTRWTAWRASSPGSARSR